MTIWLFYLCGLTTRSAFGNPVIFFGHAQFNCRKGAFPLDQSPLPSQSQSKHLNDNLHGLSALEPPAAPLLRFTAGEGGEHAVHCTALPAAVVQVGTVSEVNKNHSPEELIASWQLKYPRGQSLLAQLTRVEDIIPGINTDSLISTELFGQTNNPAIFQSQFEQQQLGSPWDTPFSTHAFRYLYDSRKFYATNYRSFVKIREGFASIPVIDLGAGSNNVGYKIANLLNSKGYVGVEPYHYVELVNSIIEGDITDDTQEAKRWNKYSKTLKSSNFRQIPFNVVAEDALSFLKRTPDLSAGIFSFGTDNLIINDAHYIEAVKEEINRVLHPDSLMICDNTVFNPQSALTDREDLLPGKHSYVSIFGR